MLFGKNFLYRMDYKFGRYAIRNFMTVIIFGMAAVFALSFVYPAMGIVQRIMFFRDAIAQGEVWRVVSFLFIPPDFSFFFAVISLYFYWHLGRILQSEWGAFKFNVFYLIGFLGTVLGGVITGSATNDYLNMSMFFALAILYPNIEFSLFFLIPVKIKYLALIDLAFYVFTFINSGTAYRVSIIVSLLNIVLFFGGDFINTVKNMRRRAKWKKDAGSWFK
ncbi:MAG: hypothetical protein LBS21_09135 [Clostridiales bacterium]|nr:hypothetical protein [Clostridiales bacterium]